MNLNQPTATILAGCIGAAATLVATFIPVLIRPRGAVEPSDSRKLIKNLSIPKVVIVLVIGFVVALIVFPVLFPSTRPIYGRGLATDLDMGAATSSGEDNSWISGNVDGELCMAYPSGHNWGAMYIVAGNLKDPSPRYLDLSSYRTLAFEAQTQTDNASVLVGIRDITHPSDGREIKYPVQGLSKIWRPYEYELKSFVTEDLSKLYIVIEIVFLNPNTTVCVKDIRYVR